MAKEVRLNIRLDKVHGALLDKMVETLREENIKTSKTDVIQRALFLLASKSVLDESKVSQIIVENFDKGGF